MVVFLTTDYPAIVKVKEKEGRGNLVKYGLGEEHEFKWDSESSESENLSRMDISAARALFGQPKMTFDLKKGGFDFGIGGPNQADSLFFNDLKVPFIKLVPDDIETHMMHRHLRIPVLLSSYPNSVVWSSYQYDALPDSFTEMGYRLQNFGHYLKEAWDNRNAKSDLKKAVGGLKSRLVETWDQD